MKLIDHVKKESKNSPLTLSRKKSPNTDIQAQMDEKESNLQQVNLEEYHIEEEMTEEDLN